MSIQFFIKVIKSCKTIEQLETAKEWITNLRDQPKGPTESITAAMYLPVLREICNKKYSLRSR